MNFKLPTAFPNAPQLNTISKLHINTTNKPAKIKKTGDNGVWISFILDESGSMSSCLNDTIGGFNHYLKTQKEQEGLCYISLTKFNGNSVTNLYQNLNINEVPDLGNHNYKPGGGTNLLDAIGQSIMFINTQLHDMKKKDRPSILVIVMTDGEENSSKEYNQEQIKDLIKSCEKSGYSFTFLGANIDAFKVSQSYGFSQGSTMNYNTRNMTETMTAMACSTTRYRDARAKGMKSADISAQGMFTAEEMKLAKGE